MTDILKSDNNVPRRYVDKNDNVFAETVVSMPYFCGNNTAMLSVGITSAAVSIPPQLGNSIRVVNVGTNIVWFTTGATGTTPTAVIALAGIPGSTPILPNTAESFAIPSGHSVFAAISNATGNTIYVSAGEGL
jgi:hypothetical protein